MKRALVSLTTATALTATLVVGFSGQSPADAYNLNGCRFGQTSITYEWAYVGDYAAQVTSAVGDWNAASVPGSITWSTSNAGAHITFQRLSLVADYWAVTSGTCPTGKWTDGDVLITLNDSTLSSLTTTQRRRVIVHEIGHAYGLDHVTFLVCYQPPSVMIQGTPKWGCGWPGNPPWADDIAGVKAIY